MAGKRLRRATNVVAVGALLTLTIGSLFAPLIAPFDVDEPAAEGARPPCWPHIMGTDLAGRDLFSRILYGGRISFAVAIAGTLITLLIGATYGAISGYLGGKLDNIMMRLVDILYGLPYMFFVIVLMALFERRSIVLLFVALGAVQWLTMSRIVRGQTLTVKQKEFVEAARACGAGPLRIIFVHIMPHLAGPMIVYAFLSVPQIVMEEAFLSFVGLGVQPPDTSWGRLVMEGVGGMADYPWLIIFPGLSLMLAMVSWNLVGDSLRDRFDPAMRGERQSS
ncbi:MAG: ABC transporter permease [Planctomycetota bacterium]|nr:ABC transporter permease [Planctomycetota bacterium]